MKTFAFFVFLFVLAGTTCFGQDFYLPLDDTPVKVSNKTIMAVIEKARVENKIDNINLIQKGQTILFRYPEGGSFRHTFSRGECMFVVVRNYLTIPYYEEMIKPRKQVYHSNFNLLKDMSSKK